MEDLTWNFWAWAFWFGLFWLSLGTCFGFILGHRWGRRYQKNIDCAPRRYYRPKDEILRV